ncbi:MAG: MFS transporter [Thiolinea sp.]
MGCIISALAPVMWVMLCGRVLQGLGGGGLVALSFVAMNTLFPKHLVPQALAFVSMVWGTSAFLGPLIGGVFASYASWRQAFVFFALAALLLSVWIVRRVQAKPPADGNQRERFPVNRLLLLTAGVLCIAYAGADISPLRTPALIILGVLLLIWFLRVDAKAGDSRLLPLNPISLRNPLGAGLTMILCFAVATVAITAYGPYLMTKIHGMSVLVAGYIVACSSIGWSLAAVAVARLDEHYDRRMVLYGMLTLTLSIAGFVFSMPHGPVWLIALFALLEGAGFGMAWTFILRLAGNIAPDSEKERIAAAIPTVHRAGYAIGAAYVGIIANTAQLDSADTIQLLQHATVWIFIACLPFAALGLLAAWRFVRQP